MNNMLKLIKDMHFKFNITCDKVEFNREEKIFRGASMQEELDEYSDAANKEEELDSLVDLVVFALGTAERQGMLDVFEEAFVRVMNANMAKKIGFSKKRHNLGHMDLIKPKGWRHPVLSDLLSPRIEQLSFFDKWKE